MRATLDTNVYIGALHFGGAGARILKAAESWAFALQLSKPILDETVEVLERDFGWSKQRLTQAKAVLSSISQRVVPHVELDVVKTDPDDNAILECSQASRSDVIVTADKQLLALRVHDGASIVRPGEFLAMLQGRSR